MADPFGGAPGIIVGVGVGAAASAALEPAIELPKQTAWQANPNRILDVNLLARLVAQGGVSLDSARASGERDGYSSDKVDALVYLAQTVPGFAEALTLWRLNLINETLFTHVLTKAGMDQRYVGPIVQSKLLERIGLGDIAYGVVRGILPSPSWVPVAPPTQGDKVPRFPQVQIDPLTLANELGFDENMLKIMVGRSGLSMAPGMAAQALFRDIIGPNDYLLAIAEGDLRTEWADAVRDVSRQILTADQYVEGYLRGWTTQTQMLAGTAKHGMSAADTDLLFKIRGRPIATHQITTGLARGGTYPSTYDDVPEPYQKAIRESNIRPEWASLDYANRYTYPTGFQIKAEAKAGDLTEQQTEQLLLELGWKPEWAAFFASKWTGGVAAVSDPHVTKAQNQLWTTTHRSYVGEMIDDQAATTALGAAGVGAAAVPAVLQLWQAERSLIHKQLSPAQVHKAVKEGVTNPATGAAWTMQEGIQALLARGYDQADAVTLLEE